MTYTLIPNIWYTITPETDCDIETPNGISIHLPAGIQYFHFADSVSIDISGTATVTQNPPLFKPASAAALGGGFIESNLRIGHGAADAVKAVCTLTLGEPTEEGTLEDNSTPVAASVSVTPLESYAAGETYTLDVEYASGVMPYLFAWEVAADTSSAQEAVDALNDIANWELPAGMETMPLHAELDDDSGKVVLTLAEAGAAGNSHEVQVVGHEHPVIQETEDVSFSGGKDRRTLHLDAQPATYAHDFWAMTHPTAGGVLVVGDHTFAEVEEKAAANAYGYWPDEAGSYSSPPIELRRLADPENPEGEYEVLWEDNGGFSSAEEFIAAFNSEQDAAEAEISELEETPFLITAKGDYAGAEGNRLVLANNSGEFYVTQLTGGQDARTLDEALGLAVSTINGDAGSPIRAEVGEDSQGNKGIAVYALEAGSGHNYDCWQTTGLFFDVNTSMAYDGEDARTLDEVAAAITAEGSDFADEVVVTHASGATTLALTATTAGKAANAIVYTSTGCFGGETVKQGSTTRGKDAVEQTDYEVILNGGAPQPLDLTSTEPLKNGHVYTLAVAADTDLSALTVKQYATCELWLDYTAGSVTWPTGLWWAEGSAPTLEAGKSYAIALRNDGVKLRANMQYEDDTPAQS